jgi:hypothetical protein
MASTTTKSILKLKARTPPITAAPLPVIPDRDALLVKYKDNLALLTSVRTGLLHIVKIQQPIKALTLYQWYKQGCVKIAKWNREEVKDREGTPNEWMESLATKISPGHFIAYWVGKTGPDGKLPVPTPENPIVIYEGGHRTRWTERVFSNEATFCGMNYETIKTLDPDTAKAIEEVRIDMTIATSENEASLVKFAKEEYHKVNSMVETLKAGELIRTKLDDDRAALEGSLQAALQRELKSKDRDGHLEDLRALTNGAAGLVVDMNKQKGTLTKMDPLTADQKTKATATIARVAEVERRIKDLPELQSKKTLGRILKRQLDLAVDGTLIYAIQDAADEPQRKQVEDDWVEFHQRFFPTAAEWKGKLAELKASTTDRGRYTKGETPFPARWQRVRNILRPPQAAVSTEPAGVLPISEAW